MEDAAASPDRSIARKSMALKKFGEIVVPFLIVGFIFFNCYFLTYMMTELNMNDFGKFYYGTINFLHDKDPYAPSIATLMPMSAFESKQFWNLNPPHFHLIMMPLTFLPPRIALGIWMLANFTCLLLSLRIIGKELRIVPTRRQSALILLVILAFSGTAAFMGTGQITFLFLLIFTLAWLEARRGRWSRVGFYLGICISVKLFMLIFLPYLILRRRYRAATICISIASAAFALGLLIFGVDVHRNWLHALSSVDWEWAAMNSSLKGFLARIIGPSPYFEPLYLQPGFIKPIWIAFAVIIGAITMMISGKSSSSGSIDRSFAVLFAGAQIISPLGWIYYHFLLMGPLSALLISWFSKRARNLHPAYILRIKMILVLVAAIGFAVPLPLTLIFQPNPWATIFPGSCYFFATVAIWGSLVIDWFHTENFKFGKSSYRLLLEH
jgi:hypothetical protein